MHNFIIGYSIIRGGIVSWGLGWVWLYIYMLRGPTEHRTALRGAARSEVDVHMDYIYMPQHINPNPKGYTTTDNATVLLL